MIDIHCHILPGVDDGAQSWNDAVEMCRMAVNDGITHTVATPHANFEYPYDREQHAVRVQRLQELLAGSLQIHLGCDFHLSYDNIECLLVNPRRYTIGATRYLLVELSDYSIPPVMPDLLRQIMQLGVRPIITHPERNPLLLRNPGQVLEWVGGGALVQLTANSLTGSWGRRAQEMCQWLLEHDAAHVVASDAHNTGKRPPLLSPARKVLCDWKGQEVADALVQTNPAAILADSDLPYSPVPK
jgi:protein-tyrosine phosphatase